MVSCVYGHLSDKRIRELCLYCDKLIDFCWALVFLYRFSFVHSLIIIRWMMSLYHVPRQGLHSK